MTGKKSPLSIESRILARIGRGEGGRVFTPEDFLDLGSRTAVGVALLRLERAGKILRVARGLYHRPRHDPRLGLLAPTAHAVAEAVAGRDATRLQPAGAYAANLLGLSEQTPMRVVFLTDGSSKRVRFGRQEVVLKRTTPRNMSTAGTISGTVIQALRHLGRQHVDNSTVRNLARRLDRGDKKRLLKDVRYAPAWIGAIMRLIAEEEES